ncbi:hypothetical protein GJ744_011946 [Endocarpon pusillum]|uniref:Uncharacterized protein n=1 Tax=Endocarpon pusillum TaxID=364733 RepID=A0A8H7APD9_9EURO|nr:hypothetical protein GJ744_011946 [Endocarpon pusillum]
MKPYVDMHLFILLVAFIALGGCWPMFDPMLARDSQLVGSPTTNTSNSALTAQTLTLSKKINTCLAGFIFLLTAGTYWIIMTFTSPLSNEIFLPSKFVEENVAIILSLLWPKHQRSFPDSGDLQVYYTTEITKVETSRLSTDPNPKPFLQPLCQDDLPKAFAKSELGKSVIAVKAFSPVMKSLVQVAIWNFFSFWLILVMVVNTLLYNGFLSNNITNDSIIRLILISVYAAMNIGNHYRTTTLLYRNFTVMIFQTCWAIICKSFIIGRGPFFLSGEDKFDHSRIKWASFKVELLGITERLNTYASLPKELDQVGLGLLEEQDKTESKLNEFVKLLREAEIKAYEKSTDSALEKVLANIAILLGICLATALAPWTSVQKFDATSVQLGSYALLLSISTGLLALVSSIGHLTDATESGQTLLRLQEKMITATSGQHVDENVSKNFWVWDPPIFGFSKGIKRQSQLTQFDLWRWRGLSPLKRLLSVLLGPALFLIPAIHGYNRTINQGPWNNYLTLKVQDDTFLCGIGRGSWFGRLTRLVIYKSEQERENLQAEGEQDNSKVAGGQQESQGTNGNSDISDAHTPKTVFAFLKVLSTLTDLSVALIRTRLENWAKSIRRVKMSEEVLKKMRHVYGEDKPAQ